VDNDQFFLQNGVREYFVCNVLLVMYNDVTISKSISLTGNYKQNNLVQNCTTGKKNNKNKTTRKTNPEESKIRTDIIN